MRLTGVSFFYKYLVKIEESEIKSPFESMPWKKLRGRGSREEDPRFRASRVGLLRASSMSLVLSNS